MKDEQLIKNLIKQGESEQLDFKEVVRKEDIAKALCAFLNARGGTVLIGVQEDGKVIGVNDADKQESDLQNYLFKSIIPEAPITLSTEIIGNKTILLAKVWNGSKPPYVFDGTIYTRKKAQTVKANPGDISKLIVERQKTELHWERQPALGIEIEDLDELEIRKTLKDLAQYGRGKVFSEKEIEDFLAYYGLYQNGNLTNAAVVLFANEPTRYLPQCRVRLTVFKGSKSSDTFIHDRILEGNIFRNIEEILQFFEVNIASKSKFSDSKWLREDTSFPKLALREGLMNALIHRDFANVSGTVTVAFYPNRLEIINSGELYGGFTPYALSKNHLSVPRNPDIAHICFLRQMIEKIGRGTIKMIEDCETKGYPKPNWQSKSGSTTLTFTDVTVTARTDDTVSDTVNDTVSDTVSDTVNDTVSDTVKQRMVSMIIAIKEKPGMKSGELAKTFGLTEVTIRRDLQKINKLVTFMGAPKSGGYQISDYLKNRLKSIKMTK